MWVFGHLHVKTDTPSSPLHMLLSNRYLHTPAYKSQPTITSLQWTLTCTPARRHTSPREIPKGHAEDMFNVKDTTAPFCYSRCDVVAVADDDAVIKSLSLCIDTRTLGHQVTLFTRHEIISFTGKKKFSLNRFFSI